MTLLHAIILGIVEGLTEFLPISSTFHLIFTSQLLGIPQTEFLKTFEVVIQVGAILAVLSLYGKELWQDKLLSAKVVVSFIPTAVIGFALHAVIKHFFFESNELMLFSFMFFGIIFLLTEWRLLQQPDFLSKAIHELSWSAIAIIGLGQAMAVVPGVSRAGAVMLTMMFLKVKREQAAKYSFLLALPTICSAALLDIIKLRQSAAPTTNELLYILVGGLAAFVTAYFVLRWFIGYLQKNTLTLFGIYRLVVGMSLFLWLLLR